MAFDTFTYRYSQPKDYHFCQDSVLFPKVVAAFENDLLSAESRVLDLCAGCGVIGFELKYYVPQIQHLDFVEIQTEFREHFAANRRLTKSDSARFLELNYEKLRDPDFANQYDLIVSNPPYFFKDDGKLSPSRMKNRCRFFIDSDFETLIEAVFNALKPEGRAYLLVKAGGRHGRNAVRTVQMILSARASVEVTATIRGTDVIQIKKPAR